MMDQDPQPERDMSPSKTPGMAVWAFVLSMLGIFCLITGPIGAVLGFLGRREAKRVGKGVGLATSAIIVGIAWPALFLLLVVVGGLMGGDQASTESGEATVAASSEPEPAVSSEPEPAVSSEPNDEPVIDFGSLGTTVEELPKNWNEAVDAYGVGSRLPDPLSGTLTSTGLYNLFLERDDGGIIEIFWSPETGEVSAVYVDGFTDTERQSTDFLANSAAAVYSTSDRDLAQSQSFVLDDLIGETVESGGADPAFAERIEEVDRYYQFGWYGNTLSFSVEAY
jgi:hypothetical protein